MEIESALIIMQTVVDHYSMDAAQCEAWKAIRAKLAEDQKPSTNKPIMPCQKHGSAGLLLVTKVVCAECGEPVDRVFVTA